MALTIEQRVASLEQTVASFTNPKHSEVLAGFVAYTNKMSAREDQLLEWMNGTATGGPNNNGTYPLTDLSGFTRFLASPAKMAFDQSKMTHVDVAVSTTIDASYSGKRIRCTNAGTITLTFANGTPVNFNCLVTRVGAGVVTLAAAAGATMQNDQSLTRMRARWALATVICDAVASGNSTFVCSGSLIQV